METPTNKETEEALAQLEAFEKTCPSSKTFEVNEVYHDKSSETGDLSRYCPDDRRLSCLMQAEMTSTDETVIEEAGDRQETITFNDGSASVSVAANPISDESMYDGFSANVDLSTYLARPVLISSINWTQNTITGQVIKPWELFFTNASIKRKLQNYAYLACNLKVKVLINASPFYYGLAFCTYRPYIGNYAGIINQGYENYGPTMAATCRQRIDVYPSTSQGGEMLLPYINVRNWMRIGVLQDFQDMGDMHIWSHDVLENANGVAGEVVTIQVFAWAEDVKVSGPTAELPMQADEYEETGPISGIASNVASLAGTAEQLLPGPFKPFAKATEIGASAVSSIASLFGFTNVPVLDDVAAYKNLPFHAMASTQISCPFEKLTLDPKNELTVDNRVAGGSGVDELTIPYLVGKKNVWSLPNWSSTAAQGTVLARINVTPSLAASLSGATFVAGTTSPLYQPPMALVARNFQFWRGTMVYRFKFVCTQYHRGRLGIQWDPMHNNEAEFNYTENYSRVIDLSTEKEIVIKVPFMKHIPYLKTAWLPTNINIQTPTTAADALDRDEHNGRLVVKVLTRQSSPIADAPIFMYVETSMEDADFANPIDPHSSAATRTSYFVTQAEEETHVVSDNIAKMPILQNPNLHKIYNGEAVFSMREIMRRRSYYRTIMYSTNTAATYYQAVSRVNRRPLYYGYDSTSGTTANEIVDVGTHPFNFVQEPTCNLFAPCFVGERGSYNYELNLNGPTHGVDTLNIARDLTTINGFSFDDFVQSTSTSHTVKMASAYNGTRNFAQTGSALTNQRTQTGLQVQIPMYSRFRFLSTRPDERQVGSSEDETDVDNIIFGFKRVPVTGTVTSNPLHYSIDMYCSIGTDYQLLHFVNVPECWVYGSLPAAV